MNRNPTYPPSQCVSDGPTGIVAHPIPSHPTHASPSYPTPCLVLPLAQVCRDALDLQPEDPTRGNELICMVMQVGRWARMSAFL